MTETLRFAAIGLDHRHIYHLVGELIAAGAECAGYCPLTSDPRVLEGFRERFPDLKPVDRDRLFDDPTVNIVCSAAIPKDRPQIAIRAMRARSASRRDASAQSSAFSKLTGSSIFIMVSSKSALAPRFKKRTGLTRATTKGRR